VVFLSHENSVAQGEGIDRAGGISVEGVGSQLIRRIDGDWNNVVRVFYSR
jgi:septum formation protein